MAQLTTGSGPLGLSSLHERNAKKRRRRTPLPIILHEKQEGLESRISGVCILMMVVIRREGEGLLLEGKATGVDAHAEVVHELSFARVSVNHTCLAVIHGIGQIDVAVIGIHVKTIKLVASSLAVFGCLDEGSHGEMCVCDSHAIEVVIDNVESVTPWIEGHFHTGFVRVQWLV
jgi:hypothetical protein